MRLISAFLVVVIVLVAARVVFLNPVRPPLKVTVPEAGESRAPGIAGLPASEAAPQASVEPTAEPTPDSRLESMDTGLATRGWEGVGRLNIGGRAFCTGALIAPDLVLTAAHCMFDQAGNPVEPGDVEFLAGWRIGRAAAYRNVSRVIVHPAYLPETVTGAVAALPSSADVEKKNAESLGRVAHDLAILELAQPIRLPSIQPFETDVRPGKGDMVGVVSYARERAEAPSLQESCHVLGRQTGVLVLSCNVDFGSSGAPVFLERDGVVRIVSVISGMGMLGSEKISFGVAIEKPLDELMALRALTAAAKTTGPRPFGGNDGQTGRKAVRP